MVAGGQTRGSADGKSGDVSVTVAGGASGTPTKTEDTKVSVVPSAAAETSAAAEPTPVAAGPQGNVALWHQCGGMDYSGPKTCSEGTCKEMNPWYSQCLN